LRICDEHGLKWHGRNSGSARGTWCVFDRAVSHSGLTKSTGNAVATFRGVVKHHMLRNGPEGAFVSNPSCVHISAVDFIMRTVYRAAYGSTVVVDEESRERIRAMCEGERVREATNDDASQDLTVSRAGELDEYVEPQSEQNANPADDRASTSTALAPVDASLKAKELTFAQVMKAIRRVDEPGYPLHGYGSVYDVIKLVGGQANEHQTFQNLQEKSSLHFLEGLPKYLFAHRKHGTPVAPGPVLIELAMVVPERVARDFRARCCALLARVFAGDETLKAELDANRAALTERERHDLTVGVAMPRDAQRAVPVDALVDALRGIKRVAGLEDGRFDERALAGMGVYCVVSGEVSAAGVAYAVIKVGKAEHGHSSIRARVESHRREFETAAHVLAVEDGRLLLGIHDSEKAMKRFFEDRREFMLVPGTVEQWIVPVPQGADTANTCRRIAAALEETVLGAAPRAAVLPAVDGGETVRAAMDACAEASKSSDPRCKVEGTFGPNAFRCTIGHVSVDDQLRFQRETHEHELELERERTRRQEIAEKEQTKRAVLVELAKRGSLDVDLIARLF
jgi:hypothetical protein